jgi:predicted metalloprotease with PDZ domain
MVNIFLFASKLSALIIFSLAAISPAAAQERIAKDYSLIYLLSMPKPHTHLYEVEFTIENVRTDRIDLQMPTWTPGSYLQREFARNVQDFSARDARTGEPVRWEKIDKSTWRIFAGGTRERARAVRASYSVYANELTVRTSHMDATHAYFNGAGIFMYVKGALDRPLKLRINAPAGWRVTTPLALAPDRDGFYIAPNYDTMIDSPTEIGTHRLIEFNAGGKPHRVAIWGEGNYDEAQIKRDLPRMIEQGALIFNGLPYEHYTFIVHIQPNIGGGLEHMNSTTIQVRPNSFAPRRNYVRFLDLAAHEFFHVWNVKRIRPEALGPFDYQSENYTRSLWVSEGVTDYYGQQLLRRAGLITAREYLAHLAREIMTYEQTPGRLEQSAESASFDAWIKFYRPDENTPNTAISYYNKGALLAWLLDFEIRKRTSGARTLDDAMRYLYENYALRGRGFPEQELKSVFERVAGSDLTDFFARYVSGTAEIDFDAYLQMAGLRLERGYRAGTEEENEAEIAQREAPGYLGFRTRATGDRVFVSNVLAGTTGYEAGINTGDELLAINGWRVDAANVQQKIASLTPGQEVSLTVSRRERIMNITVTAARQPPDRYLIRPMKEVSAEQRSFYDGWLQEARKAAAGEAGAGTSNRE